MVAEPDFERITHDAVGLLELLCRQPSVSAQGQALEETADLVEQLLAEAGFETRQLRADNGAPAVYGEQAGRSGYTLLLYNHYDVQPVDPLELWKTPPFVPSIRDNRFYARGAADNKGELAVRLAVVRAFREQGSGLPIRIRWIVEGEEEVGSTHFDEIVQRNADLLRADGCLWEGTTARLSDGRPSIGLGFKGVLVVRLDVRVLRRDVHSAAAAVAPSAAWRLVDALSTLRDRHGSVRIAGFYDSVQPPTDAERRALTEASEAGERDMREELGTEFLDSLTGVAFRERGAFGPTCNISGISSGYRGPGPKTVLTAEASALLDLRLVPNQHPQEILELLRAHLRSEGFADIEITALGSAEAAGTPIGHPFVQRVAEVAREVSGSEPSITPRVAATLPIVASLERHVGVPGVAAPDNPLYDGARVHAPNENVRLEDVGHSVRFTYALFEALA
jgi:acetylornithine deacetylase/succinyl-diaminopimelate desuccinylase-like protein